MYESKHIDPILTNLLGLYNVTEDSYIIVMPNHLLIMTLSNYMYDDLLKVVALVRRMVGSGEPMYSNVPNSNFKIRDAIVYKERNSDATVVYVPQLSYCVMYMEYERYQKINELLSKVVTIVIMHGYPLDDLMREKALTQYIGGKLVTIPELKESDMVRKGGVPLKALQVVNRYVGRVIKYVTSGITFDLVKHCGKIGSVTLDVTLPISRVVVALNGGERVVRLDNPIIMSGTLNIGKDGVTVSGALKYHPNVNEEDGTVCLGTVPPFDGTLTWVARLLNTLMVPRIDSCGELYSGSFIDKYRDKLPGEILDIWDEECRDEEWDEEEYWEEDDYYDEEYDDWDEE